MPNKYLIILMTVVMLSATEIYAQIKDCTECATRELTSQDIEGKSLEEVAMLRNEIFARHGYRFGDGRYRAYFEVQEWYEPAASNKDIRLSATEKKKCSLPATERRKVAANKEQGACGCKTAER